MYEISSWAISIIYLKKNYGKYVNGYWLDSIVTNVCYIKEK